MLSSLAVLPDALGVLQARLSEVTEAAGLAQVLRALQRLGLSTDDLHIHLERARAVNDVLEQDPLIEANCLTSLDIIFGNAGDDSLRWDAAEMARLLLPQCLDGDAVTTAIEPALARSDLLPPRQLRAAVEPLKAELTAEVMRRLGDASLEPQRADFYRVPKVGFTSRPAALLAPQDRICWEALANLVSPLLEQAAPVSVVWPRNRAHVEYSVFSHEPFEWDGKYVVRTDIESFYESIDHSLLAMSLASALQARSIYTQSVEFFLDTVMGAPCGIPQGPPASEIFASCHLLLIDKQLGELGFRYVRYVDDYAIEAQSVLDGRQKLELLESRLREIGLRLSSAKTRILRASTYRDNTGIEVSPRISELRARLRDITEERLRESEDEEELADQLLALGAEEQTMFDLLYHRATSLDEVIEELRPRLNPTLAETYAAFAREEAAKLLRGEYPEDTQSSQADLNESLVYLSSAQIWIGAENIAQILQWHPTLAPMVAVYIRNVGQQRPATVRPFLRAWLRIGANTDWVQSWACSAAESEPRLMDKSIRTRLHQIARSDEAGLLTRAGATRALAAARVLDASALDAVVQASSAAMASELYLDSLADPEGYAPLGPRARLSIGGGEVGQPDSEL